MSRLAGMPVSKRQWAGIRTFSAHLGPARGPASSIASRTRYLERPRLLFTRAPQGWIIKSGAPHFAKVQAPRPRLLCQCKLDTRKVCASAAASRTMGAFPDRIELRDFCRLRPRHSGARERRRRLCLCVKNRCCCCLVAARSIAARGI